MSETIATPDSTFPASIDIIERFVDPDISSIDAINQYYQYWDSKEIDSANAVLEANTQLKRMIINAANLNPIVDAIIAIEQYYLSNVQQYLMNIVVYKGDFVYSTKYYKFNIVSYQSGDYKEAFMCINDNVPIGTLPTNVSYWIPLVVRGEKGDAGVGLSFKGAYSGTVQYSINDAVQYNGSLYGALQANIGTSPTIGGDNEYWALAWHFIIPNNYITMGMLSSEITDSISNAKNFTDDTTSALYRFGADNGAVYVEIVG